MEVVEIKEVEVQAEEVVELTPALLEQVGGGIIVLEL